MNNIHKTDDVYGITRDLPINYIDRNYVDDEFFESLRRNKHIVVYGSSKQGKTSLRKKHLSDDKYILISCQTKWNTSTLHSSLLKQAGFEVEVSHERAVSGAHKVNVKFDGEIKIPFLAKANLSPSYEYQKNNSQSKKFEPLDLDPLDVNDIIRALNGINFSKFIILEDFHYLPQETQEEFSYSLKSFHENSSYVFIVVGVWREENRLIGYNGDLLDRVQSINADAWSEDQLYSVITAGEQLLNINFSEEFKLSAIKNSLGTVHLVQEACRKACLRDGILETYNPVGPSQLISASSKDADDIIKALINGQRGRYHGALANIAEGFQETDLKIPKWIVYGLLSFGIEEIQKGIKLRSLSRIMKAKHPEGRELNNGSITQTLKALGALQNKKGVRPLIFDYDTANRMLTVVDKGFIIWYGLQDKSEIFDDLDLPAALSFNEVAEIIS